MKTPIVQFIFGTVVGLVIALDLLALPTPVRADSTITICDYGDFVLALHSGGTVTFNCNGNYSPGTIHFNDLQSVTITQTTTIDGSNGGNTIYFDDVSDSGTRYISITNGIALTLTNIILAGGFDFDGGCIYTNGALVLDNVQLINCRSYLGTRGGAIYVGSTGSASINNTTFLTDTAGVSGGGIYNLGTLTVTNSYFTHTSALNNDGGAIWTVGTARIDGSTFFSNTASNGWGGAIYNQNILSVTNSTLSSNFAYHGGGGVQTYLGTSGLQNVGLISNTASITSSSGEGGGLLTGSSATSKLTNVMVKGNTAYYGGGIFNNATTNLTGVTVSGNSGAIGGGIENFVGTTTILSSTISGNHSASDGAGIYSEATTTLSSVTLNNNSAGNNGGGFANGGTATLTNVTFSGNHANLNGGGLANGINTATLRNVTLNGNTANSGGGVSRLGGTLTLTSTIVANSPSGGNCAGTLAGGFNMSSDLTCNFGIDRDNRDVKLAPLGNYGGSTQTHLPLLGSPAIDFGTNAGCPSNDERGLTRPISTCDVGAVERQSIDISYFLNLPLILR